MGARSSLEARALILHEIKLGVGIEAVRSIAQLKLDRIAVMRGDLEAAEVRRGRGRATWHQQRRYRARRDGFARAQHFNEGGVHRNHL